jgi:hypothetical protein
MPAAKRMKKGRKGGKEEKPGMGGITGRGAMPD